MPGVGALDMSGPPYGHPTTPTPEKKGLAAGGVQRIHLAVMTIR
jgi:hypothetical protein